MKHLDQSGDTIIEVILSLVILVTVLVSALTLSRFAILNGSNALFRTQAINLVQEQYEVLRAYHRNTDWQTFMALKELQDGIWQNPNNSQGVTINIGHPEGNLDDLYDSNVGTGRPVIEKCDDASLLLAPPGGPGPYPVTQNFNMPNVVGVFNTIDSNYDLGASGGADPDARCFHFERDARQTLSGGVPNPTYGDWVACPGSWYAPIGYDSNWNQNLGANGEAGDLYYQRYFLTSSAASLGCRGSYRTLHTPPIQPNIYVGISSNDDNRPNCVAGGLPRATFQEVDYMRFMVAAVWNKGGTAGGSSFSARGYTSLNTILGNDSDTESC